MWIASTLNEFPPMNLICNLAWYLMQINCVQQFKGITILVNCKLYRCIIFMTKSIPLEVLSLKLASYQRLILTF